MIRDRRTALIALGTGALLFALAPPVIKLLTTMGGELGLRAPGAISLCNVLFVGNMCAGLVTLLYAGPRKVVRELTSLRPKTWGFLWSAAVVSAIYPALLFTGLEKTSVINVVLLSRFNGIVFVVLAAIFLRTVVGHWEVLGYAIMAAGVVALIVSGNHGLAISSGEAFVLASTLFFAITEVLSRFVLRECSIHTYVCFRNAASAIIFFATGMYLFGIEHFAEAFTRELWVVMVVYSAIAVVAAQVLWLSGARALTPQSVANLQLLSPAFTLLFAFLLLSEVPGKMEWLVLGVIVVGILVPRLAGLAKTRRRVTPTSRSETPMTLSPEMGLAGR